VKTLSATADRLRQRRDAEVRWVVALTLYRDRFGAVPTSTTYYLSDRARAKVTGGAGVLGQDWLPLVRDWGALARGLEPLRPGATPATLDLVLSNTAPIGGIARFTSLLRQGLNTSGADLAFGDAVLSAVLVEGTTETTIPLAQLLVDDLTNVTEETVTLRCNGRETLLDLQVVGADYDGDVSGCPTNGEVSQSQAESWYGGVGTAFHLKGNIYIVRPGSLSISAQNTAFQEYGIENQFPVFRSFRCRHWTGSDSLEACQTRWAYISFENMPYWANRKVDIGVPFSSADLFDPALGNGVQIWCADTPGSVEPTQRQAYTGYSTVLNSWGTPPTGAYEPFAGDPPLLPQRQILLAHAMSSGVFPLTFPVPLGRTLIICTGNQNPQTMPLGTDIFYDATVSLV
jgi:hypothetical protein